MNLNLLFAITHLYFWHPLEPIARNFCGAGHRVQLLLDRTRNKNFEHRFTLDQKKLDYEMGWMTSRRDAWQFFLPWVREYLNYLAYLKKRQPTSPLLIERWSSYLFPPVRWLMRFEQFNKILTADWMWRVLHRINAAAPPSRFIIRKIQKYRPGVVVAASAVLPFSKEIEYVKAAFYLGIPTIVIIPSWDNLTTKGTLQVLPDWLFVWNEKLADEAIRLHNVPEERIFCTGAPKFDPWFDMFPTLSRQAFCQEIGLRPDKPFFLYLCSSEFIAGDETAFIEQLAINLSLHLETRDITILVRPHPQNLGYWRNYQSKNANVILWPKDLLAMGTSEIRQDFYHSLYYSKGVLGINTSAFIEAAIVDKPCVSIASEQYELTQMGIPHFKHLLAADFLELPGNFNEAVVTITKILEGRDRKQSQRRAFVQSFIRPHGVDRPASEIMSRAILNVARGNPPGFNL